MFPRIPPVTRYLLIANVAVFLAQKAFGDDAFASLMLWPWGGGFMPWQLLSYAFLHGSFNHIFFNLMALWMFGAPIEQVWGAKRFLTYFIVCAVGAGLLQLGIGSATVAMGGAAYPTLGASGGIFGLLLAYAMLFPHNRVMLVFPPIPMSARTFVILYGITELVFGWTGWEPGVAHFAHLGGLLFGWLLIRYWRGQWPFGGRGGPKPPKRPDYMRIVK